PGCSVLRSRVCSVRWSPARLRCRRPRVSRRSWPSPVNRGPCRSPRTRRAQAAQGSTRRAGVGTTRKYIPLECGCDNTNVPDRRTPMDFEFDRGIAHEALGDGAYAVNLPDGWVVGGGVNGGFLLAVIGNAIRAEL